MTLRLLITIALACITRAAKLVPQDIPFAPGNFLAVRASSVYIDTESVRLEPRWALDGSSSQYIANCFASELETSPWWSLDLGRDITPLRNVLIVPVKRFAPVFVAKRLVVGIRAETAIATISCRRTDANTSDLVEFSCPPKAAGRYVNITVTSSSKPSHLVVCEVIINRDVNPVHVNWSRADAVAHLRPRSGGRGGAHLAIDGKWTSGSCAETGSNSATPWLRVDLRGVYFVTEVHVLFAVDTGKQTSVGVGSGARQKDVYLCEGKGLYKPNIRRRFLCAVPQLANYVLIRRTQSDLKVCEIDVLYDQILNLYGDAFASAWNQFRTSNLPFKAIDGGLGTSDVECYQSRNVTGKWWQLQLAERRNVSRVRILSQSSSSFRNVSVLLDGSVSCVRSSTAVATWTTYACPPNASALSILVEEDEQNVLTLCEVELDETKYCEESPLIVNPIFESTVIRDGETLALTCRATGCPPPRTISWFDSSEELTDNATTVADVGSLTSSLAVTTSGTFICIVENGKAFANATIRVFGQDRLRRSYDSFRFIASPPDIVFVDVGDNLTLIWRAKGKSLPQMNVRLVKNGRDVSFRSEVAQVNSTNSTQMTSDVEIRIFQIQREDAGAYWCEAGNTSKKTDVVVLNRRQNVSLNASVSSRSAELQWKSVVDNVTLFYVIFKRTTDRWYKTAGNVSATNQTDLRFILRELEPLSKYKIGVVPWYSSDSLTIMIETLPDVASKVANFSVTVVSSTVVALAWDAPVYAGPRGIIFSYRVYYELLANERRRKRAISSMDVPGNETSADLRNLQKFARYRLQMTAISLWKGSPYEGESTAPVIIRTGEDVPSAPRNVSVHTVTNSTSTLQIRWIEPSQPNGNLFYFVLYRPSGYNGSFENVSAPTPATNYLLTGLPVYTEFEAKVQAKTQFMGPTSASAFGSTDQGLPSGPLNVTLSNVSDTSVIIKWLSPERPQGRIIRYSVCYQGTKQYTEAWKTKTVSMNRCLPANVAPPAFVNVTGLLPVTLFSFTVNAHTVKGKGNSSDPINIITRTSTLMRPLFGNGSDQCSTLSDTLNVSLNQPSNIRRSIDFVQLLVTAADENNSFTDLDLLPVGNYSRLSTKAYIAAQFNYTDIPRSLSLGDDKLYGGFLNARLKTEMHYKCALRSLAKANDGTLLHRTSYLEEKCYLVVVKDCPHTLVLIGIVEASAAVVFLLLLASWLCLTSRKRTRKNSARLQSLRLIDPVRDVVALDDFSMPSARSADPSGEVRAALGETAIIGVLVTGRPRPSVRWNVDGRPAVGPRAKILANGSLQIADVQSSDAGVYQCCATNCAGTTFCQIALKIFRRRKRRRRFSQASTVSARSFEDHVEKRRANQNDGFLKEFDMLDPEKAFSTVAATEKQNREKNAYIHVLPYDHSRVKLGVADEIVASDYINASVINGFEEPLAYIASQGPMEQTVRDFWRMIWQENVQTIVMLTSSDELEASQFVRYWPDDDEARYGKVQVVVKEVSAMPDFFEREFGVSKNVVGSSHRTVMQFHFSTWTALMPPNPSSLLSFIKRVRSHHDSLKDFSPMVIHCTEGAGRTGAYIAIDFALRQLAKSDAVGMFASIREMRRWRPRMVQTEVQYIFCHRVVLEHLRYRYTRIYASKLDATIRRLSEIEPETGRTGWEEEYRRLDETSSKAEDFTYNIAGSDANAVKNRYDDVIAPDQSLVFLSPPSNYINAYKLSDGFRRTFIATQGPFQDTCADFWRMVWEYRCSVVVMLSRLFENDLEVSALFWPVDHAMVFGTITVVPERETIRNGYMIRQTKVTRTDESLIRMVTIFHYLNWPSSNESPDLFSLLRMVRELPDSGMDPIVVMCNDGVGRSGTFAVVCSVLDRLDREHFVDVFQTVKTLRSQHPDILPSIMHYIFCYMAALEHLDFDVDRSETFV